MSSLLMMYDVSDPENPVEMANRRLKTTSSRLETARRIWSTFLAATTPDGLVIWDVTDGEQDPVLVSSCRHQVSVITPSDLGRFHYIFFQKTLLIEGDWLPPRWQLPHQSHRYF